MSLIDQIKELADKNGWSFSERTYPNENVAQVRITVPSGTSAREYEVTIVSNPWTTPFTAILNTGLSAYAWSGLLPEMTMLLEDLFYFVYQRSVDSKYGLAMKNPDFDSLEAYVAAAIEGADRLYNAIDMARSAVTDYRDEVTKLHDSQSGDFFDVI